MPETTLSKPDVRTTDVDLKPGGFVTDSEVHGVSLSQYADIMTCLASGQPREATLLGAGLDERTWLEVEKTWGLRLAKAAQAADSKVLLDFAKSVELAQKHCSVPTPTCSWEEYATMVASIEGGAVPITVCARFGLKLSQFFQIQQAWTRRITQDPNFAAVFREQVEVAKRT